VPAIGNPQDAMMSAMRSVIHPEDQDRLEAAIVESMRTGEGWHERYRRRTEDGYRWLEGRTRPLRDADGNLIRWYGLAVDIDDEYRAKESLQKAKEELEKVARVASLAEVSASIAHELSQPLASLTAGADACSRWLDHDPPNVERAQWSIQNVRRDAELAANIVKRVRSMFQVKLDSPFPCDVNHILRDIYEMLGYDELWRRVELRQDLDASNPKALCDPVQIRQIIINLLRNALEAMAEHGVSAPVVSVSTRYLGSEVLVIIEDNGPGVNNPARIFDPFFSTKAEGLGIGLAICKTIIDKHGGRIWVENTGEGARFAFLLPLAD